MNDRQLVINLENLRAALNRDVLQGVPVEQAMRLAGIQMDLIIKKVRERPPVNYGMAGTPLNVEYRGIDRLPGYRVGNDGSAWSCWRRVAGGKCAMSDTWRRLKGIPHDKGYLTIGVRRRHYYIHCLILEAFVGPCPEGMECRHDDGNRANNRLENLSWGTPQQNADDRVRHGTSGKGEANSQSILTAEDVREIVRLKEESGMAVPAIACLYGRHVMTIWGIFYGRSWGHVTGIRRRHHKPKRHKNGRPTKAQERAEDRP